MKITIYLYIGLSLLFCSCSSTYYYATLSSTNSYLEKLEEEDGDFLFENDSLWITHCFRGEDAPIQITIFNKLDIPLYVDWDRSALIINNTAYSYNDGVSRYFGESESTSYESWAGTTQTNTNTYATSTFPKSVSFIPPKSKISHQSLRLSAKFDDIDMKDFETKKMLTKKEDVVVPIKSMDYNHENSPFHFSSYVTVYTDPGKQHQAYKLDFYTSNLTKTSVKPQNLPIFMIDRGDVFYQCKRPNTTGWEILGVTTLLVGATAMEVLVSDKKQESNY